ncbi:ADP-ribosylglycohydrolase family protein [Candidatus Woesearchaeota archaeon]|nr:ADP-ribosylglycohydrolase family protein [Candidatus Woesearchaeota archaeon]
MKQKDLLLGLAIGDAFGAGVEFKSREWIRANVDFQKFVNAREGSFVENYSPWDYTDDTEMTVGVINALLSGKELTPDMLVGFWKEEYQDGVQRRGFGRQGHGSMQWYFNGAKSIEEIRAFQRDREYPGNAPPMRAIPFAFVQEHDINRCAVINADATHPHPRARVASIIVARAAEYLLLRDGNPTSIVSYCQEQVKGMDKDTDLLLQRIDELPRPEDLKEHQYEVLCGPQPIVAPRFMPGITGLPSDAMLTGGCVLYVLKHAKDAMDGLRISVRIGGDVDSLASICTGILAGKHGLASLPSFMIENVEGREKLTALAETFERYLSMGKVSHKVQR